MKMDMPEIGQRFRRLTVIFGLSFCATAVLCQSSAEAQSLALKKSPAHGTVTASPEADDNAQAENARAPMASPPVSKVETDESSEEGGSKSPFQTIGSVVDAMRAAIQSYVAGNKEDAMKSLSVAADQGHAPAQWKMARMYAEGDGVPRDDMRAFDNYSRVCDRHADDAPDSPTAPFVSSAFIALGTYYLKGIPDSPIKPDPRRAREMFTYSATYFGDPQAQFVLAHLYFDGVGGQKDRRQGMRWLNLSAEKGYRLAQGELGRILFHGDNGPRQKARGLMWLTLASDGADPQQDAWILEAQHEAVEQASEADRTLSATYLTQRSRQKPEN
jgi:uncharacterized protein